MDQRDELTIPILLTPYKLWLKHFEKWSEIGKDEKKITRLGRKEGRRKDKI